MATKSKLSRLDYLNLYSLYDKSTDEDEKKVIKEVVDEKADLEIDPMFQPYPDYHNKKFQDIIYKKKEFYSNQSFLDTSGIEDPCNSEFSIKPHQSFLKNFITKESPYRSLLIYHGVGVGKTCSGITVAENFRDIYARKDKRILILSSKKIQEGWKKTIYNPAMGKNQCTGETFSNIGDTERKINKVIKEYYELMAYQSFSNHVKRLVEKHIIRLPESEREKGRRDAIHQYFSNRLIIIDEVHNIRDEQGGDMRDAVKTIEEVIKYSENIRLLLLTATPMYNRSTEMVWILNMMLLNDKRPLLDKKDIFTTEGELTEQGSKIIKDKSRGYISYLRGENPITFPIRLYPSDKLFKGNKQKKYSPYTRGTTKGNTIISKRHKPVYNIVGGRIKDELEFLELFGSSLQGFQETVYTKAVDTIKETISEEELDSRGDKNPILDNIALTQITDMVYPNEKDDLLQNIKSGKMALDDLYGERGLKHCMNKKGQKYSYKKGILETYGPIFDKGNLSNYSCKLKSIIDSIDESEGIVFIYTNYVNAGIIPLQLALEQNGYKKHGSDGILQYPGWTKGSTFERQDGIVRSSSTRELLSYKGELKSQAIGGFQQATYMVIDSNISKQQFIEQMKLVNSKENKDGQTIKVILGTVVASEGLDFKRIRSVHILDPWLHLNRIEQTVGRAIRFCSHADLPPFLRNVLIYLHVATLRDDRESIDTSIYRYAEKKSIQIGKVETILKRTAVDRYLYKDVNVITKGEIQHVIMKTPIRGVKEIYVDPSYKPYSKVCSYSIDCNYYKGIEKVPAIDVPNADTFFEQYSSATIQNLQRKIALLYKSFYVFDIDSIKGLLDEYGFNQDSMIYQALYEMVIHKYILHDKYGNSGYIINRGIYYVYQPFITDDESIPLYYRMNLLQLEQKRIMLPRLDEILDEAYCSKTYTRVDVESVYEHINELPKKYEINNKLPDNEKCGKVTMPPTDKKSYRLPKIPDIRTIINIVSKVYTDLNDEHPVITMYIFDRLSFEDKCKLLYGYFRYNVDSDSLYDFSNYAINNDVQELLSSMLIYKSDRNIYTINNSDTSGELFGFVLPYNHKPVFYEYHNTEFMKCDPVQVKHITKSIKSYTTTRHYRDFIKNTPIWGYTIERTTKDTNKKERVLKLVQSTDKTLSYPPGPGNVCIGDNAGAKKEKLSAIIKSYSDVDKEINKAKDSYDEKYKKDCIEYEKEVELYKETNKTRSGTEIAKPTKPIHIKLYSKANVCFLLELLFRYEGNGSFYSYDKVWLKYY